MADNSNHSSRNLLVIKASAGSGKTYNLALQYIRHLLFTTADDGHTLVPRRSRADLRPLNAHRLLLAITFTNKATDEMKDRIVEELYKLSQPGVESDYLKGFMEESGMDEAAVRELARLALNELLFDYSNFNVSTIDSFFQSILRNFARELDRDFNYDIQLEEKYAVGVAVHQFLLSLGREGKPTQMDQWVKEYQRHMIRGEADTKKWKFFDDGGDLQDFAQQINSEIFRGKMAEIRDYLGTTDDNGDFLSDFSRIRSFKKYVHDVVAGIEQDIEQGLAELMDTLAPMADGLKNTFKNWVVKGELLPLSDSLKTADEEKIRSQFKKDYAPGDDGLVARLLQLVNGHFAQRNARDFFRHIEDNLGLLGMLAMIDIFLERYRHETNSILIGDTNELIATVLASGSDFVYERVGSTIAHFMIDEFQDTSTKQYENFRGLLSESLSNGNFNMLIGDAKQSIYRFRNADPTVFRERVDIDFKDDIYYNVSGSDAPDIPASTNFRSSRNIIGFNNDLFEFMSSQFSHYPAVLATYSDVRQAMPPGIDEKKVPGYVRLLTGDYKSLLNDDFISGAMLPADLQQGDEEEDLDVLTLLPAYLQQLHLRYDWGQIGILVNTNNQGNKVVERILEYNQQTQAEPISIISGESLLLNNSPIIRRVIAMLRFIDITQFGVGEDDGDENDQAADSVKNAIARKRYSDQRLYNGLSRFINALSAHADADAAEAGRLLAESLDGAAGGDRQADMDEASQAFARTLARLLPADGELTTLVNIVETIISHFKSERSTGDDVDRESAFLFAFQDTVMQFCSQRNGGSIREFLKFWDEKKDKLAVSSADNGNAVNIMTIHAAKGLEFDCVVIPFANWELDGNSQERSYWMPRDAFLGVVQSLQGDAARCDSAIVPPLLHVEKKSLVALGRLGALQGLAHDFVAKQQTDVLIDNLNKTYVAMTRPRSELHLFAKPARTSGSSRRSASEGDELTLPSILARFGREMMTPMMTAAGTPAGWFETGVMSSREELEAKKASAEIGDTAQSQHLTIGQYTVNPIPLKVKVRVDYASSTSIDAGLRLHGVMSRIRDWNDVDSVVSQAVKHGVITDDPDNPCGIDSVNRHVVAPIKDSASRIAAWFDPANKVYSERTITTASDNLWDEDGIENLRPDRIIRRPDGQLLVIDYKSGQRDDRRYLRQLGRYIGKLRLIFPDAPIAGRLWYVTHDLILDETGQQLAISI